MIVAQQNSIFGDRRTYFDIIKLEELVNGSLNWSFLGVERRL